MWAVVLVAIVTAFIIYLVLTSIQVKNIFATGDKALENIDESGELLSIGANPQIESNKLTILSNQLQTYAIKSRASFSLSVFLKVDYIPRTGTYVDCDTDVSTFSGKYDCTESRFRKCRLGTANTVNPECKREGYRNLFRVGNCIRIELLETQNPQRPGMAKAQLSVKTQELNTTPTQWMETFSLPAFPIQKWIMLTIVREGNTYSVYYNDRVVGSFKTQYVPYVDQTLVQLGDGSVIKGNAVYLSVFKYALSVEEIAKRYLGFTDTTGKPKLPTFIKPVLGDLCVSGNCFQGPAVKPANPFVQWTQEYS